MSLLTQIISGRKAAGASADYRHSLAGFSQLLAAGFPDLIGVMLNSSQLQVPNGNRFVQTFVTTGCFTRMRTDMPQTSGNRQAFMNQAGSLFITSFLYQTDIFRHIGTGWAGVLAGSRISFGVIGLLFIHQRTSGTDGNTGAAETAVRIHKKFCGGSTDIAFSVLLLIIDSPHAPHLLTGTHTASAQNAAAHIVDDQRVTVVIRNGLQAAVQALRANAHILHEGLQLTIAVFGAGRAIFRVGSQQQLEGQLPALVQFFAFRADTHPLLHFQCTGGNDFPVIFHQTQTTGPNVREVGVMAKVRDIDTGVQCSTKDALALGGAYRNTVNFYGYSIHSSHFLTRLVKLRNFADNGH